MGYTGLGVAALLAGCGSVTRSKLEPLSCDPDVDEPSLDQTPLDAPTNGAFDLSPARALTPYATAIAFNNFYEFTQERDAVWCLAQRFRTDPWNVEITGLTTAPRRVDLDDLRQIAPQQERIYRFRCVEAWSMTVPWTGIPLADFIRWCQPSPEARYVRFVSAYDPDAMTDRNYVWPYYESLRMDEALHELGLLAFGMYGRELTPQNGAPVRLVLPWKYGYKSIKSIARVEFVAEQPATFWNDIDSRDYSFLSNVDPTTPHSRWSQAQERLLHTEESVETLPYNGYGEWVASLYA